MNPQQRIAALGTDKELSDLLDFSAMFSPPVNSGKNRPTTLGSSQFSGSGVEGRTNGSSWSSGSHSSPTYDSPRAFPDTFENRVTERGHPSQDTVPSSQLVTPPLLGKTSEQDSFQYTREAGASSSHQGPLQSELDVPNPRPLSSPTKPASPYYFSGSNRRRHLPDSGTQEVQSKKVRKVPPGLPSSVSIRVTLSTQAPVLIDLLSITYALLVRSRIVPED
uniref:transcription factor 12-like n=1 Tax=Myxine glutinosa TaxID=7769 RepID=UPI00358FEECE